MPNLSMVFDVLAVDRASAVFNRVGDSAIKSSAQMEAASESASGVGKKVEAGFAIAAAAAAVYSVKMAADFQSATTRLVTSAGETQGNLDGVRKGLLDMMGQVGYSSDELTKAMYKVESGGQHGADGLAVLKAAAQGAKTENADLTTVADAVTSAMQDYHLKASDAADVTSKLVAATSSGKMTFEELAGSLSAILPIASANHVSLNDILGDLASMTVHGMSAEQASQNLADTVKHVAAAGPQATKELASLGLSAEDLSANLGQRGLSGSLNIIADAIQKKIGPGSTQVIVDLEDALKKLPKPVQAFAQGLLDGTKTVGDFRQEVKLLPADQAAALQSFEGLITSTHQVGAETKSSSQIYQSYSGALRLALGDATSMNTALMLTGENTKTTSKAIEAVTGATADAQHNVKGWSDIQGTFNQQLSESAGHAQAMAIEFGTHLLPVLTDVLHFINGTAVPGLEHIGSAVGDSVHWFSQLPAPIKDFAFALAGLALADKIGMFDKLSASVQRFRDTMALQSALAGMEQGVGSAEATVGRFGTTLSRTASGGLMALKSGASGLLAMFGGPWGLGIAAAVAGVVGINSAFQAQADRVQAATDQILAWKKAQDLGGQGAVDAGRHMDELKRNLDAAQKSYDEVANAADGAQAGNDGFGQGAAIAAGDVARQKKSLDDATKAYNDYRDGLTPVQMRQIDVTRAQNDMNYAMSKFGDGSPQAQRAADAYKDAQSRLAAETGKANGQQQTQLQLMEQAANVELGAINSTLAAKQAQSQLSDSIAQYNKDAGDGQHSTKQLADESLNLAQQAESAAESAGKMAADQAKANGVVDNGTIANAAMLKSLQDTASHMTGPGKDAVLQMIAVLQKSQGEAGTATADMTNLGLTVIGLPAGHKIEIDAPTADQQKRLDDLGYTTVHLPNGHVVVTADTHPAEAAIQDLLNYARQQSIQYRSDLVGPTPNISGGGLMGHYAEGGYTGPGAKYTPAGIVHAGEFVFPQESVDRLGVGFLGALAGLPGYASGGWVGLSQDGTWPLPGVTTPVSYDEGPAKTAIHATWAAAAQAAAQAVAASAGGAARWAPLVDQVLAMLGISRSAEAGVLSLINSESGGNPNAINLWDSNAKAGHPSQGLMQTIPGTFARWRNPSLPNNILDPLANIYAGVNYALHTYGTAMLMGGGRHVGGSYVGYKDGTNYVPSDQFALLHKGEAVIPADRNQGAPFVGAGGPIEITGTLEIGGDGLAHIVDGRIVHFADVVSNRGAYNG